MRVQTRGCSERDRVRLFDADQATEKRKKTRYPTNDAADVRLLR
jgi:hypothetical protein